jgi:hypothetical protein
MAVQKRADKRVAYVYDIYIDPPLREVILIRGERKW